MKREHSRNNNVQSTSWKWCLENIEYMAAVVEKIHITYLQLIATEKNNKLVQVLVTLPLYSSHYTPQWWSPFLNCCSFFFSQSHPLEAFLIRSAHLQAFEGEPYNHDNLSSPRMHDRAALLLSHRQHLLEIKAIKSLSQSNYLHRRYYSQLLTHMYYSSLGPWCGGISEQINCRIFSSISLIL